MVSFLRTICFWSIAIAVLAVDGVQAATNHAQSMDKDFVVIKSEIDKLNQIHKFRVFDTARRIEYEIQSTDGLVITDVISANRDIRGPSAVIAISCRSLLCIESFKSDFIVEIELENEAKNLVKRKTHLDKIIRPPTSYADTLRHRMLMIDDGSLGEINSDLVFSARNFRHFAFQDGVVMRPDNYAAIYVLNSRTGQIQNAKIAVTNIGLRAFLAKDFQVFPRVDSERVLMRAKGVKPSFGINDLKLWNKYFREPTISDGFFVINVKNLLIEKFNSPRKFYCGKVFSVEYRETKVDIRKLIMNFEDIGIFESYSYRNSNSSGISRRGLCICRLREIQECNFSKEADALISKNLKYSKDDEGISMYYIGNTGYLERYVIGINGVIDKNPVVRYEKQSILLRSEDLK